VREPRSIIKRPIMTEKADQLKTAHNKYSFEVALDANRIDIKRAVEELFRVKVLKVTTQRIRGKIKRMGRFEGKRPDWKKAIVTLAEGNKIDIFEGT
jgi:large subunit ribosomal protein L23